MGIFMAIRANTFFSLSMLSFIIFQALPGLAYADHDVAISLEDMEVTGQRAIPASTDITQARIEQALTPGGVTLIDVENVREGHVAGLADMLRYVPGVWSNSS